MIGTGCSILRRFDAFGERLIFVGRALALSALLLTVASSPSWSAELRAAQVSTVGESYQMRTEVMIAARAADVRDALARYEMLPSLNPNIESVDILPRSPGGAVRLLLRTKTCVLFLCQRYQWVQHVKTAANGDVVATIEPDRSDFHRGAFHYRFRPMGDSTLMITEASVQPKDGVPGGWFRTGIMRQLLGYEAITLSSRLERLLGARTPVESARPA